MHTHEGNVTAASLRRSRNVVGTTVAVYGRGSCHPPCPVHGAFKFPDSKLEKGRFPFRSGLLRESEG